MPNKLIGLVRAALEHLNRCSPPAQPVLDEPDSWLALDLLEMLMATVRTGLDGEKVVDLAAVCPELYEHGELWWPLNLLPEDILPRRRAGD